MISVNAYIKKWQQAIQLEIQHLKKYGNSKYRVVSCRLLSNKGSYSYYLETTQEINVPACSTIEIIYEDKKVNGRIISTDGTNVIISLEERIANEISEMYLVHDPWELLDKLFQRLQEIKGNKQKRIRMKRVMDPSIPVKHPKDKITSNVHELILRSKYNPVTFVWGPPGTGKTYTLARAVVNKFVKGKRIIVLAHSNQAVDVLMNELSAFTQKKGLFQEGAILRYGTQLSESRQEFSLLSTNHLIETHFPDLAEKKDQLLEKRFQLKRNLTGSFNSTNSEQILQLEKKLANVLEKVRQKEIEFVKDAAIVGATLAKAASDPVLYEQEFDLVVLDEASMAYVPQVAFACSLAKRAIICGDFKQLPPIAAARHPLVDEWLREDIFHRAGITDSVENGDLHPHLFLLREQRRMHPDISSFTNKHVYHSLVGDHESVKETRKQIVLMAPFSNRASILLDTNKMGEHCMKEKTSHSKLNVWQLLLSFQLIHESYIAGVRSIGYVTPYRAQAALMGHLLQDIYAKELQQADIIAATVHRFQGSERDCMIFDTVDGYPLTRAGLLLTGKNSERLINVAITRTKGKFIHVCDSSFITNQVQKHQTIRKLVDHQLHRQQGIFPNQIGSWIKHQHSHLQWIHARKLKRVSEDIRSARRSIILSLPLNSLLSKEWIEMLNQKGANVELTLLSNHSPECLFVEKLSKATLPFPFVLIDRKILWLGLPLEAMKRIEPPYVAARLDSEAVGENFYIQLPLDE